VDDASPGGFSGQDVLDAHGPIDADLPWMDGVTDRIHIEFRLDPAHDVTWVAPYASYCTGVLGVPVWVDTSTDDGALDEHYETWMNVTTPDRTEVALMYARWDQLGGTLDVSRFDPSVADTKAMVYGMVDDLPSGATGFFTLSSLDPHLPTSTMTGTGTGTGTGTTDTGSGSSNLRLGITAGGSGGMSVPPGMIASFAE